MICMLAALAALSAAAEDANAPYQGPPQVVHDNDEAKLVWLIGGIAVILFIAATSITKCLFSRQKPMRVAGEPDPALKASAFDEADEEAKVEDFTQAKDLIEVPNSAESGRNAYEDDNLKAGAHKQTNDSFK